MTIHRVAMRLVFDGRARGLSCFGQFAPRLVWIDGAERIFTGEREVEPKEFDLRWSIVRGYFYETTKHRVRVHGSYIGFAAVTENL